MTKNRVRNAIASIQQVEKSRDTTNPFSENYIPKNERARKPDIDFKPLRFEANDWPDSWLEFSLCQLRRDENLAAAGFASYSDYLQSQLWEWIREELSRDSRFRSCLTCGSRSGLQWHHRTYSLPVLCGNFSSSDAGPIIRLCAECHVEVAHLDFPQLGESDRRLMQLRMLLVNGESYRKAKVDAVQPYVAEKWQ